MNPATGRLAGKRAVVTGASLGIGRATAIRLASEGAHVGLIARRREPLEAVAAEIAAAGGTAHVAPADVSDEPSVSGAIDAIAAAFGAWTWWSPTPGSSFRTVTPRCTGSSCRLGRRS